MAVILPETPLVTTSPEVARLHRLLKQLPDEAYAVWHRLTIHSEPGPDFWILRQDRRAVWIKVATLTSAGSKIFTQADLFQTPVSGPAEAEQTAVFHFARAHFATPGTQPLQQVPSLIVFPNLTTAEVTRLAEVGRPRVHWLGKESLSLTPFLAWLEENLSPPLSLPQIAHLRQAFTPEIIIPPQFTVRASSAPLERHTTAASTPYLLDYDQERVLKTDLELSEEAQAMLNDFNLRLINGVAGSGKSLIVVYRAQLLRQLYPHKRILGLTHNRPLIRDLQARYHKLNPAGRPVEWLTFYQWCRRLWPAEQEFREPIGIEAKHRVMTQIWHTHLSETTLSDQMLHDEIDWCKDRLIFSRAEYLKSDRTGRGFALSEAQRHKLYDAFENYQRELNRREQMDWGDVPRQLWRWIQRQEIRVPHYDVILVDEAQFFAPLWFELVKRALKPKTGHLFLVADPTQGFLKRRQSWAASGLEVRGRTHRLKKSYRTTREILDFATLLYRTRVPNDDEIELPDLLDMPTGAIPQIIALTSEQDEITRVVNEIEALLQQGIPKHHILVIHTDWYGQERLLERLRGRLGPTAAIDPKEPSTGDTIRVSTLNAVTGLESPIVFLVGVHQLFEQEQSLRLSDDERIELVRDNTRKMYMALTRAGQRIVLTYVGELPSVFQIHNSS